MLRNAFLSRFLVLMAAMAGLVSSAAQGVTVSQFQPQGRVSDQTRVTVLFSADMVKLGETGAAAPFKVNCGEVSGEGRWADARTWAWQLSRALGPGEKCEFVARADLKDLNGEGLGGRGRFEFFAAAPRPWQVFPRAGSGVDEDQVFVIDAGAPLKAESLEKNLWCEAEGVGQRMAARPVSPQDRQAVLKHLGQRVGSHALTVACSERLPVGSKMKLVWGLGIRAQNGAPTDKEESLVYKVREPFKANMSCEREKAGAPCSPLSSVSLEFNAPFEAALLSKFVLTTPEGKRQPLDPAKQGDRRESTYTTVRFPGPLPQNAELVLEIPAGLKDGAGRELSNATSFPLKLRTGSLPPLAKFPGSFGIIELNEGALLPVTLRNVEPALNSKVLRLPGSHRFADQRLTDDGDVIAAMAALSKFEQQSRKVKYLRDGKPQEAMDPYYARELSFLAKRPGVVQQSLPKPGGSTEFEVVGIPLGKPGYHIVEIESQLLGNALLASPKPMFVRAAVLVTNLAVHLKLGRDNALVWVTALDTGKAVAEAAVSISGCDGKTLWQGKTDAQGRALVDKALARPTCRDSYFLMASARLGEDYSFVRSDWNEGIEPWRFGVETWGESSAFKIHTVLDRSLFRAGQTVSMKLLARTRNTGGFAFPGAEQLPNKLVIRHRETGTEFSQPLSWDAQASATGQWKVPESAKRGDYDISLVGGKGGMLQGGGFRVADFRLPVFTGSVQGVPGRQVAPATVPLALGLSFLNGGAARNTEVSVSATLRPRWPSYAKYEQYRFTVDLDDGGLQAFGVERNREDETLVLDKQALKLDKAGAGKLEVALPGKPKGPSELYAEMTFPDPNGEFQTLRGTVELWPAALVVGMRIKDWAASGGDGNRADIVVLDTSGKPVAGQAVSVRGKRRIDYSHRRRIVGGFYAYENQQEYKDLGEVCSGKTDSRGIFECVPRTRDPGSVYLLAETRDAQGNMARASASYWVTGAGDLWFTAGNQDRIDVIPEKPAYKPGEVARLQVRTPFREAMALVSVEAGGIIESFVQPLSRFKPVVELPIKAEWGPNAYVSVLTVRGRVQPLQWFSFFEWGWREPMAWFKEWWHPTQPTAMVDLAKPAYRLGLGEINVGVEGFRLKVEVSPDKGDYRPREEATVKLKVSTPDGKPLPAGTEVAFAAVDQALLELRPNDSWNLLEAMLPKRAYEVETATAQSQVIGKRHFGKKALPPGGGGGRAPARELFDTLLTWQPRVKVDGNGVATVKVPLNDSLSEFKLVGVATAGAGLFGSGSAAVRTKQDLQLISGLPPLVREGDRFQALLTLRNGTAKAMTVAVTAKAGDKALAPQTVKLEPEGAAEIPWSAQAPEGVTSQVWEFNAKAEGGPQDGLRITQQIAPAVPVTVQQATFTRVAPQFEVPVTLPSGALPGKGGLEISLSPRLATPPPGLLRFFQNYPYSCLEQKTSVAVGLHDEKRWQEMVASLPGYLDGNGLASYFPGLGGNVALTAYLLDMSSLSGFALPEDSRRAMAQGLIAFVEGRLKVNAWAPSDSLLVTKLMVLEALARQGNAVAPHAALVRVANALEVDALKLPTHALIDWYLVTRRLSGLANRDNRLAAATQEIRNRLSYTGARLTFTTERNDYWWWLMISGDSNAFRLVEATLDDPAWQGDLPRLMQGAMERQGGGHWQTTTGNAWARVTLDRFAQQFEKEAVGGTTRATLGKAKAELAWKSLDKAEIIPPLSLPWPATPGAADKLSLAHEGSGKPWATVQVLAAIPGGGPKAMGYRVGRKVTPIQEKTPGKPSRGDLWRVTLTVDADVPMNWVVVNDPIPAGARILGDGDGRDSAIATRGESQAIQGLWPSFIERSFSAYRAYYEMVPKGRFQIEYTLRLNNSGDFALPPTRVEAMYAPEVFGEVPNGRVLVRE